MKTAGKLSHATVSVSLWDDGGYPPVTEIRKEWLSIMEKIVRMPLTLAAEGRLNKTLPRPSRNGVAGRSLALEMMGRILAGIAPWLGAENRGEDRDLRREFRDLFQRALAHGCHRENEDFWGFGTEPQSLVDAAFLSQALIRAPVLVEEMNDEVRNRLVKALKATREIKPARNNWLLFSACVEAALGKLGATPDRMRVDYSLWQHEEWYVGDGVYGDGPRFQADYYNSFVIQPMLLDVLLAFEGSDSAWDDMLKRCMPRFIRYAAQQERMIARDGSWPPLGRSITYRCGAFHGLATMAWKEALPEELAPAQVRGALTASIRKSLGAPDTFSGAGWFNIGLCGNQPSLGENYICVSSQYLACFVFPPLGLSPDRPFWSDPDEPWTQVKLWERQEDLPADRGLRDG